MKAEEICRKAAELVAGDRAEQHGDMHENFANIAELWSAWLGVGITKADVAAMMALLKLARTKSGAKNEDDAVDAAGYCGIMGQLQNN
jgi:hypothetical protein